MLAEKERENDILIQMQYAPHLSRYFILLKKKEKEDTVRHNEFPLNIYRKRIV